MTSIAKVAARAGVSATTVSHAINHAERVSKPLRERVQAAIDELGYVPNRQAQSLRTGRTGLIAMLIPDIRNPFYPELVKTAQSALERVGLDTLIFNTDVPGGHSQEHGRDYLRQVRHKRVDGLIVGDFALHGMHDELLSLDCPTVFIGHLPNHAVDSVKLDDFGGGRQMGEYLAGKGHRRVAHVTGPVFFKEAMARAEGFEAGFAAGGGVVDPALKFEGSYLPPSGQAAARWLVDGARQGPADRGVLCQLPDGGRRAGELSRPRPARAGRHRRRRVRRPAATRIRTPAPRRASAAVRSVLAERATAMLLDRLSGEVTTGRCAPKSLACTLSPFDTA